MEMTAILIFVIVGALAALFSLLLFRKKGAPSADHAATCYAEGLNLLLAGEREQALEKLKLAVGVDSENVDAYVKIGDILRSLGDTRRAINVHKYLTVRKGLSLKQHSAILQSLACDYFEAEMYEQALKVLQKVLDVDRNALWAQRMRLKIYEATADWPKAFQAYKALKNQNGGISKRKLALFKVREGLRLSLEAGDEKDAQACFKEAIRIDPEGPAGYIAMADSYVGQKRKDDALRILRKFIERAPADSYLVFGRLKDLLYEGGVYGEIEHIYHEIKKSQPDNLTVRLALAENFEKKGELERAVNECLAVLEKDPENKHARTYLVKLHHKSGNNAAALEVALGLIDEFLLKTETRRFELSELLDADEDKLEA